MDLIRLHKLFPNILTKVEIINMSSIDEKYIIDNKHDLYWNNTLGGVPFVFIKDENHKNKNKKDGIHRYNMKKDNNINFVKRFGKIGKIIDILQLFVNWVISKEDQKFLGRVFQFILNKVSVLLENIFHDLDFDISMDNDLITNIKPLLLNITMVFTILLFFNKSNQIINIIYQTIKLAVLRRLFLNVWSEILEPKQNTVKAKL